MKYGKTIGGTLQEKENQSTIMTHEAYLRPLIPLQSEIKILKCSSSVSYKTNKLLPRSVQQFMRLTDCRTNVTAPQSELSAPKIGQFTKNICCPPACGPQCPARRALWLCRGRAAATRRPASSSEDRGQEASVRGHTDSKEVRTWSNL